MPQGIRRWLTVSAGNMMLCQLLRVTGPAGNRTSLPHGCMRQRALHSPRSGIKTWHQSCMGCSRGACSRCMHACPQGLAWCAVGVLCRMQAESVADARDGPPVCTQLVTHTRARPVAAWVTVCMPFGDASLIPCFLV